MVLTMVRVHCHIERGKALGKRLRIQTVCGFGVGTSMFLKMKVDEVVKSNNLNIDVYCGDVTTCTSSECDAIFTSAELAETIGRSAKVPVIVINSFINSKEITEKTLKFVSEVEQ